MPAMPIFDSASSQQSRTAAGKSRSGHGTTPTTSLTGFSPQYHGSSKSNSSQPSQRSEKKKVYFEGVWLPVCQKCKKPIIHVGSRCYYHARQDMILCMFYTQGSLSFIEADIIKKTIRRKRTQTPSNLGKAVAVRAVPGVDAKPLSWAAIYFYRQSRKLKTPFISSRGRVPFQWYFQPLGSGILGAGMDCASTALSILSVIFKVEKHPFMYNTGVDDSGENDNFVPDNYADVDFVRHGGRPRLLGGEGGADSVPVCDPGSQTVKSGSSTKRRRYGRSTAPAMQLTGVNPSLHDEESSSNSGTEAQPIQSPNHGTITTSTVATSSTSLALHTSRNATAPTHFTAYDNATTYPEWGGSDLAICPECDKPRIHLANSLYYMQPAMLQAFCTCAMGGVTNSNIDNVGNIGDQPDKSETKAKQMNDGDNEESSGLSIISIYMERIEKAKTVYKKGSTLRQEREREREGGSGGITTHTINPLNQSISLLQSLLLPSSLPLTFPLVCQGCDSLDLLPPLPLPLSYDPLSDEESLPLHAELPPSSQPASFLLENIFSCPNPARVPFAYPYPESVNARALLLDREYEDEEDEESDDHELPAFAFEPPYRSPYDEEPEPPRFPYAEPEEDEYEPPLPPPPPPYPPLLSLDPPPTNPLPLSAASTISLKFLLIFGSLTRPHISIHIVFNPLTTSLISSPISLDFPMKNPNCEQ
ncbi:hypothetical protein CPC08DRAFT_753804 [Agrocybe pediades]|nr:hypothetical protein CPC08DRAFT_753804 [Agrocybe pediades]